VPYLRGDVFYLAFFLGLVVKAGQDVSCMQFIESCAHPCDVAEDFVDLVGGICPRGWEDVHLDDGVAAAGYQAVEFLGGGAGELGV
jgi:hypothetical protein